MQNPETPPRGLSIGRIADAIHQRRSEKPAQTAEERKRAARAGEIIAVQKGVIEDLKPFDAIYSGTVSLLQGVRPQGIDYLSKKKYKDYSKNTPRSLWVESTWHCPNLLIPEAGQMVNVDFIVKS